MKIKEMNFTIDEYLDPETGEMKSIKGELTKKGERWLKKQLALQAKKEVDKGSSKKIKDKK